MSRPPIPPDPADAVAWSFTRHRRLRECERAVFWTYFGSRGLGLDAGDRDARRAFALRHLTTLPALVGTVVHAAAREAVAAARDGAELPALHELVAGARFTLNQAWRTSQPDHVDRFWRYPGVYTALHEVVYRGALGPGEAERAGHRVRACLAALLDAPVLGAVRACAPGDVWLPDTPLPVRFAPAPDQRVWGAVDFAYRHADANAVRTAIGEAAYVGAAHGATEAEARAVPDGPAWCVVDWKTGLRPAPDDERLQLGVYGLCLEARGFEPTCGVFLGRVVDLVRREDRWYVLDARALAAARATIAADVTRQRALMEDPAAGRPLPKAGWALARHRGHCARCNFAALCRDDLRAEQRAESPPAPADAAGARR